MKLKLEVVDHTFICIFYLFAFIGLIFEPIYYFGCNWKYSQCIYYNISSYFDIFRYVHNIILDLWYWYNASFDPIFLNMPLWLQVLCGIEVFVFGPCYLLTAYYYKIYLQCPVDNRWFLYFSLIFSGALVYSTVVYFTMEILDTVPNTNMAMVFIVNLPWTIVPILFVWRVISMYYKDSNRNMKSS